MMSSNLLKDFLNILAVTTPLAPPPWPLSWQQEAASQCPDTRPC